MGKLGKWVYMFGLWLVFFAVQAGLTAAAAEYGFAPVSGQMTSPFGWRTDPITGHSRFHGGVDIAASTGMPVYAPQAGYVMFSGTHGGYGKVVVLNHGNSLYTLYGHNSQLLVKTGDTVYRGQVISQVGSTGRSTGPHLHFEVHYNNRYLNPVTYLSYLQQTGPMLARASQARHMPQTYGAVVAGAGSNKSVAVSQVSPRARKASRGKTVQLVTGTDIETIRF